MSYEKKYKEALKWMQSLYSGLHGATKEEAEKYFPELKESEDERIRNFLIDFIKICTWTEKKDQGWPSREDCLTWLEKQVDKDKLICELGEYKVKYTQKVLQEDLNKNTESQSQSKFKVGNWIANGGANPCYVKSIFGDYYELCSCEGFEYTKPIKDVDYIYHLWTIQDAKDGDVLVDEDNNIGLYLEEKDDLYWYSRIYLGCDNRLRGFSIGAYHKHNNTKPATKEQRDLLFQKIKEAGYEWDSEKKGLKKIEPKKVNANKVINWVNPDKVIEWLKGTIRETEEYFGEHGEYYSTHLTLPHNSIKDLINDFKEDFGL